MTESVAINPCPGGGCHSGCMLRTRIRDGKILKTERLVYDVGDVGTICRKGVVAARLPYHADRLKYPLKRVGDRGAGQWQRITWEQALDEIAAKMRSVREQYGNSSVAISPRFNSVRPVGGIHMLLGARLQNLLQATSCLEGCPTDSNSPFASFFSYGISGRPTHVDARVLVEARTRYIINWGSNPADTQVRTMEFITKARKKGAKFVNIGLLHDATSELADWWIPVRAGSDGAMALAMIHVIIEERLYDAEYLRRYTNAPFLVRTDNGKLLRESDLTPHGGSQEYVVWDADPSRPVGVASAGDEPAGRRSALTGTYPAGGVTCKPVFQLLAELASRYAPSETAATTGVNAESVTKLAREFAGGKPTAILTNFGLRYANSGNAYRAMDALVALTGNVGLPGGGRLHTGNVDVSLSYQQVKFTNDVNIMTPTDSRALSIPWAQLMTSMSSDKPYPIRALIMYGSNWFHTYPNRRRWLERVLPNLELIVVDDIFMTTTAEYADYVLPDCTAFERDDVDVDYAGRIVYQQKAIEPLHECRPPAFLWSELGKRLGLGQYFDKTVEEWLRFRLNSGDASVAGIEPALTFERLQQEKVVKANIAGEAGQPLLDKHFLTPSGRVELYSEELIPSGDALPVFREQREGPRSALAQKFPLVFLTAHAKLFSHTMFANDPTIQKSAGGEPRVSINPADAKARGIVDGDVVLVYNDRGSCQVKAELSEVVSVGVVNIPHGWWPKHFMAGHQSDLIANMAAAETADPAREIFWSLAKERNSWTMFTYSPDILFDCLCEVKKVD